VESDYLLLVGSHLRHFAQKIGTDKSRNEFVKYKYFTKANQKTNNPALPLMVRASCCTNWDMRKSS